MKRIFKNIIILIVIAALLSTNVFNKQSIYGHVNYIQQPVRYTQISYKTIEATHYIARWYQKYRQKEGIHYRTYKGDIYILISAGQRPTDGYRAILSDVRRISRGAIYIRAGVMQPSCNKIVVQDLTYPHLLIKIDDPRIIRVEGTIN